MDERNIKKLVNDPNAWAWDGCTYSDMEIDQKEIDRTVAKIKADYEAYEAAQQKKTK